jgi:hypothetical protein
MCRAYSVVSGGPPPSAELGLRHRNGVAGQPVDLCRGFRQRELDQGLSVITDTEGWQHFRRLNPALLISPATDGLENRATMGAGIRASWTASSGTLVLEAEGTADLLTV